MKEGYSTFYDFLDKSDLDQLDTSEDFSFEAPISMLFTADELGVSGNLEDSELSKTASALSYYKYQGQDVFESDVPEIWKIQGNKIIRNTPDII